MLRRKENQMNFETMNCQEIATAINSGNLTEEQVATALEAFNGKACDVSLLSGDNGPPPPHP
jgi:hypothetical protein